MPAFAIRALTGIPDDGCSNDAIAEAPNAIEPTRFSATILHGSLPSAEADPAMTDLGECQSA